MGTDHGFPVSPPGGNRETVVCPPLLSPVVPDAADHQMTDRVLIANRGEIAVRIIRTCRQMGLSTIAVYSDVDRDALHVRSADDAVRIGPAQATNSYLNIAAVADAARHAGATAVHPGYGFLAENAGFAARCRADGLVFIGPATALIEKMGAKITAKEAARAAGVSIIPGSLGSNDDDETLRAVARDIGAPFMIKASAGGGGRGMRLVHRLQDFDDSIRLARAEARTSFGDPAVFIERALVAPRHVEVQILGDQHGNVLHLCDRDCSIQRFNQKILEEAPAPFLPATLRAALADHAARLARSIGYDSVGTIEFLVDPETNEAFFLEMNTRLQVEHTVTEMVTGIDLVEWQIRTAMGEPLTLRQADLGVSGCAIEARVAAENPAADFTPTFGTVGSYREPRLDGVRIDSGIDAGTEIGPYYDSLLLKIIAHGADRNTALKRLDRALAAFQISGLQTNLAFLGALANHPDFEAGRLDTNFLGRVFPDGWQRPDERTSVCLAAAVHTLARVRAAANNERLSPWRALGAWRVTAAAGLAGRTFMSLRDEQRNITDLQVTEQAGGITVTIDDDTPFEIGSARLAGDTLVYERRGRTYRDAVTIDDRAITIHSGGGARHFHVLSPAQRYLERTRHNATNESRLIAPMPGLVTEVYFRQGDPVEAGQTVLVLEAMKLLHPLSAPVTGTIAAVHCSPGNTVDGNTVLVEFNHTAENGN